MEATSLLSVDVLPVVTIGPGPVAEPDPIWAQFESQHAEWCAKSRTPDGHLFTLPEATVRDLHERRGGERLIELADLAAEIDFRRLCEAQGAIGFGGSIPIRYEYLVPEPGPSRKSWIDKAKAQAGWLLSDPDYLAARALLEQVWNLLPENERPPRLPSHRPTSDEALSNAPRTMRALGFVTHWHLFSERWQVERLATWNLPVARWIPPGTCRPLGNWIVGHERPSGESAHVDQQSASMRRRITSACAHLVDLTHYIGVIRKRYLSQGRQRGRTQRLYQALGKPLELAPDRVADLLTYQRKSLDGNRPDGLR